MVLRIQARPLGVGEDEGINPGGRDVQEDAHAIVDKALKAMGGEAKVAKFKAGSWKSKAMAEEGGKEIVLVCEGMWQGLDKLHIDAEIMANGRNEKAVAVINGEKGW